MCSWQYISRMESKQGPANQPLTLIKRRIKKNTNQNWVLNLLNVKHPKDDYSQGRPVGRNPPSRSSKQVTCTKAPIFPNFLRHTSVFLILGGYSLIICNEGSAYRGVFSQWSWRPKNSLIPTRVFQGVLSNLMPFSLQMVRNSDIA